MRSPLLLAALALAGCVRLIGPAPAEDRAATDRPRPGERADGPTGSDAPSPRDLAARDGAGNDLPGNDAAKVDVTKTDLVTFDAKKLDAKKPDSLVLKADLSKQVPGIWILVQSGAFTMGSPPSEPCRGAYETQHLVTLSHDFRIQSTEVTQAQFLDVRGYNPSYFTNCGASCPVETVSWHEAAAYCNELSARAGVSSCYACAGSQAAVTCSDASAYAGAAIYTCPGYRLPTEAEWEKAYRAGSTTGYYNAPVNAAMCGACAPLDPNVDAIAWHCGNAGSTTHPIGGKTANALGLRDMAGNVREWCHDFYVENLGSAAVVDPWGTLGTPFATRVARGGAYGTNAADVRAAAREHYPPADRSAGVGFRCVISLFGS